MLEGQLPKGAAYLEENETEKRPSSDEKGIISPGEISEYIIEYLLNITCICPCAPWILILNFKNLKW